MLELVLTSAKNGLIPGRSGFCSVAWTEGMPQNLVTLLENMSGYNALYAPNDPMAIHNPVCYSYQKVQFGRSVLRIVSRIAFAGLDYTGRSNKIAHHIILNDELEFKRMKHGPISLLLQDSNFYTEWNEPPRLLPIRKKLEISEEPKIFAENWQQVIGDARWAGHIADIFDNCGDQRCIYLEYDHLQHGKNILYMIDEITRLLPLDKAREFTFTTCFSAAQNGCSCFFRGALPSSTALPAIRKFKSQDLISVINKTPFPDNIPISARILKAQGKELPVLNLTQGKPDLKLKSVSPSLSAPAASIDSEISLNELTIGNYSVPAPEIRKKTVPTRLIIFLLIALFVFFGIIGSILFLIFSDKTKDSSSRDTASIHEDVSAEKKVKAAPQPKTKKPDKQIKTPNNKKTKSADTAPQKNSGAKNKPQKRPETKKNTNLPPRKSTVKLPPLREPVAQERYNMLYRFMSNTTGEIRIQLPESLRGAQKITVKLKEKWFDNMGEITISQYIDQRSDQEIIVYPLVGSRHDQLKPDKSGQNLLRIALEDANLIIRDGNNRDIKHAPDRTHIEKITFHQGQRNVTWEITFEKDFVEFVAKGTINDDLKYQQTHEEKLFSEAGWLSIDSKELNKFQAVKSQMEKWDDLITKINALKKDAAKIKFTKLEDLKKSHDEFIKLCKTQTKNANDIKKAFDTVTRYVVTLSADDEKNWLKKRNMNNLKNYLQDLINEWDTATDGKSKVSGIEKISEERNRFIKKYETTIKNLNNHKKELKRIKDSFDKFNFPKTLTPDYESVKKWDFNSKNPLKVLTFIYDDVVEYVRENHDKYIKRTLNSDN